MYILQNLDIISPEASQKDINLLKCLGQSDCAQDSGSGTFLGKIFWTSRGYVTIIPRISYLNPDFESHTCVQHSADEVRKFFRINMTYIMNSIA